MVMVMAMVMVMVMVKWYNNKKYSFIASLCQTPQISHDSCHFPLASAYIPSLHFPIRLILFYSPDSPKVIILLVIPPGLLFS